MDSWETRQVGQVELLDGWETRQVGQVELLDGWETRQVGQGLWRTTGWLGNTSGRTG